MKIQSTFGAILLAVLVGGSSFLIQFVTSHKDSGLPDQPLSSNNGSLTEAPVDAAPSNVFLKMSDTFSRATQLKLNCTEVEHCDEPPSHEFICWMQAVSIVASFCVFVMCYLQYRIRSRAKRMFKSQVLL